MQVKKPKKRIDEPTEKMKRYADNRAKGMNKKDSAIKAGYSESTATTVKQGIEQKSSFEKLLNRVGLTKDLVCSSIVEDIKKKKGFRASEIALAMKILGLGTDKLDITTKNLTITFDSSFKPKNEAQNDDLSKVKPKTNTKQPENNE